MSWSDWIGVATDVGNVIDTISSLFGDAEGDTSPSFSLAEMTISYDSGSNTYTATNNSVDSTVNILFNTSQVQDGTVSTLYSPVTISPGSSTDVTNQINAFTTGKMSLAAASTGAAADPISGAIVFSIISLSVAAAIKIIDGVTASFSNSTSGWTFSLSTTNPLNSVTYKIRGLQDTTVTGILNFSGAGQPGTGTQAVVLPSGMNISPTIAELDLTLQGPAESINALFQRR